LYLILFPGERGGRIKERHPSEERGHGTTSAIKAVGALKIGFIKIVRTMILLRQGFAGFIYSV